MIATEIRALALLLGLCALCTVGIFCACLLRGLSGRRRRRTSLELLPRIRETLVEFLSGKDDRTRLRQFLQTSREDVSAAVMSFQGTVAGSALDRLCELSLDLALVHDWCQEAHARNVAARRTAFARLAFVSSYEPSRRVAGDLLLRGLDDRDEQVRLSACRALVHSGDLPAIERVLETAVSEDPLVRILLTGELRPYAAELCQRAIPQIVEPHKVEPILALLQIVAAWERALPLAGLGELLVFDDRRVRLAALPLALRVPDTPEVRGGVLEGLASTDAEIACLAAEIAGRMRLEAALPGLARCVRIGDEALARLAAASLAEIPPRGWSILQELSPQSRHAAEALARARGLA